mmetsp:Transcript_45222/g.113846  ORF Transcript_45222/g.113846 Transcript_45222/m.113846 type:complete len:267 (-) Transcript_45222:403-1203(-)|eukprot:CAMPEP_0177651312 /NCGR_PEP_ID=MMETSP0447-20121125/12473_1 /TAXON_ID=0 /ORGANISM="Stygamoeba regulata, Strain BSH-02190019" /LENGTH=266 /DNA_ID=CAMNT_0019154369 /DNA_START=213 /DNA_END=1013 /DNA_ORIENTATION=+
MGAESSKDAEAVNFSREAAKRAGREAYRRVKMIADQKWAENVQKRGGQFSPTEKTDWDEQAKQMAMEAAKKAGRIAAELAIKKYREGAAASATRGLDGPGVGAGGVPPHLRLVADQLAKHTGFAAKWSKWAEGEVKVRANLAFRKAASQVAEGMATQQANPEAFRAKVAHAAKFALSSEGRLDPASETRIAQLHAGLDQDARKYLRAQTEKVFAYIEEGTRKRCEAVRTRMDGVTDSPEFLAAYQTAADAEAANVAAAAAAALQVI